jgi:hypothetical protein
VFGNRVLRISVPKREEVTGGWRKLHNNELHNLYSLPDFIRKMKWFGCVMYGRGEKCINVLKT